MRWGRWGYGYYHHDYLLLCWRTAVLSEGSEYGRSKSTSTTPFKEAVLYKDLNHFLEGQVGRLPGKCRQVYRLSRNSGLTIPEIAKQFSLSEKTVEAHLTKALRFLKTKLTNQLTEK